ncbi:MAG: ParB N-terminal domain-containing protein [Desulfosalsimonadaceae bacterium]
MNFRCAAVGLDQIDVADAACRISIERPIDGLAESIDQIGLLNPPFLVPFQSNYRIVSGFHRIRACLKLGRKTTDARLLPANAREIEILSLAIADNAQHRELHLIEQARAIACLNPFFPDAGGLAAFAKKLGLSVNKALVSRLLRINRLPGFMQNRILSGAISMTIALELESLHQEGAEALSRLFEEIRPSLNEQKEILALVKDIAGAEERSVADVVNKGAVAEIRRDQSCNRKQKTARIRSLLRKRRYPAISRFEALFAEKLRSLNLPEKMDFKPPPGFEGEEFGIHFTFQSQEEFDSHLRILERIAQNSNFTAIMNKSHDDSDPLY